MTQTSFSDPRILEYINDGGDRVNAELSDFLTGLAFLANLWYGDVGPAQAAMQHNMARGMSVHEAAAEEYDFLRKTIMG